MPTHEAGIEGTSVERAKRKQVALEQRIAARNNFLVIALASGFLSESSPISRPESRAPAMDMAGVGSPWVPSPKSEVAG